MARILLLEDDLALRAVVKDLLEDAGYEVEEADNGLTGLKMFRESPSDLVLTDIRMPEKSGNETIIELREEFPDVKIVAMSGGGAVNPDVYMKVARKLGADAALAKPFAPEELLAVIQELA